ncbi:hypothetical protein DMP23_09600 [Amycolatopsis sp. A1MSW2902]|uniref:hypothetical protein n=1 Tax=Amycolatopsis sp. A1MSW2902 TaxID=687413 RepID=UPI00307F9364
MANGTGIAVTGGELVKGITAFSDGPEERRKTVRRLIEIGVDQIKLSMTGEKITDDSDHDSQRRATTETAPNAGATKAAFTATVPKIMIILRRPPAPFN